jgi:hypothetical protein
VFETVKEVDSNVRGQMETLRQGLAEVLDRKSVLDWNLKNIYNVCEMCLKNMTDLEKSNRTSVRENFGEVKEAMAQCGGKTMKEIGSAVRGVSDKLIQYGDILVEGQVNMENAIQENRTKTNA